MLNEWYLEGCMQGKPLTASLSKVFVWLKRPFWRDLRLCECADRDRFILFDRVPLAWRSPSFYSSFRCDLVL